MRKDIYSLIPEAALNHHGATKLDIEKFKKYYQHVVSQVYDEGDSPFHKSLTVKVVDEVILPLGLPKDSVIYDLGCGPGYFLDKMSNAGYTNLTGITFSQQDRTLCRQNGHTVKEMDISFLDVADSEIDFIFSRHSLEHSPFPYITLMEYNRALKLGGLMYVEVPSPGDTRKHEFNVNHYSVLGADMWKALFVRSGFDIITTSPIVANLTNTKTGQKFNETYYMFVLRNKWKLSI